MKTTSQPIAGDLTICRKMMRKKPITETENDQLNKCMGFWDIFLINIGGILGSGVYSAIGLSAYIAGPAVILSFATTIICNIFTSLPYVEFAARIEDSGASYSFGYASLGEFIAFLIGHSMILNFAITASAISRSWSSYLSFLLEKFSLQIPVWLLEIKVNEYIKINLISGIFLVVLTFIMLRGAKDSIMFNNIISVLNCVNIVLILIAGMFFMDTNRFTPFIKGGHVSSVLQSFGLAYFATIGFDAAACYTKEAKNPKKDIPLAIITSLIFSGMIYILIAVVSIGMAPIDILGNNQGLVMAFAYNNQSGLAKIISLGSLIGLTTTTFVSLLGQPRVFFSMSEDGLLHSKFAEVNSVNQVPVFSTYVTGITAVSVALFFDIEILANVISLACLMCYGLVCLGTVEMRYEQSSYPFFRRVSFGLFILLSILLGFSTKLNWGTWISILIILGLLLITGFIGSLKQTNIPDKFVCPMVPYVPLVGVFSNFYIFGTISLFPYILFVVFIAVGCLIYFNYSIKHSKLNRVKRIMNTKEREITLQLFK